MKKASRVAAAYVRMSTDQQDTSIDIQEEALRKHAAKHNIEIVSWYKDEGISGDASSREQFDRLIRDAQAGQTWDLVLCFDQDRFSRFPPLKANHYWYLLDEAGIELETVKDGKLDFTSLQGWLVASIQQMSRHEYLPNLSHKVCPGLIRAARDGRYTGGPIPYGMRVNADGHFEADDSATDSIATVQWIFNTYATQDVGFFRLATMLNDKGIVAPKGGRWLPRTIKNILSQEKYAGDLRYGKMPGGKYYQIRAGEVVQVTKQERRDRPKCGRRYKKQPAADCVFVNNCHEGIIDRQTWNIVASKLSVTSQPEQLRTGRTPTYPLTTIARCHCGKPLCGHSKTVSGKKYRYYKCATNNAPGGAPSGCGYRIQADELEKMVLQQLHESILSDSAIEKLVSEASNLMAKQRTAGSKSLTEIDSLISEVDSQLTKAEKRVVDAPDDMVNLLYDKIRELRAKKDELEASRDFQSQIIGASASATRKRISEIRDGLKSMREKIESSDVAVSRQALKAIVSQIVIEAEEGHGRRRSELKSVTVRIVRDSVSSVLRSVVVP